MMKLKKCIFYEFMVRKVGSIISCNLNENKVETSNEPKATEENFIDSIDVNHEYNNVEQHEVYQS
ncbi:MAG: hypothetical protein JXR70_01775 [Spirochaetales bacterium]|nr:hypothetical protein [Spirochaetales bacterium]